MEVITGKLFEVGVRFDKVQADGKIKKVVETYIVDAQTFTEGEKNITGEMSQYISGEFDIVKMKPLKFVAVLARDGADDDRFWKVGIVTITLDEKTGLEKRTKEYYLVQSLNIHGAMRIFEDYMHGAIGDWAMTSVQGTSILDIIRYKR